MMWSRGLHDVVARPFPELEHERYRLFEAITEFLVAIARQSLNAEPRTSNRELSPGLLLLLDDLHWADTPTLLLIQHLARRTAGAPLLVAGAYRPEGGERGHPLAAVMVDLNRERLSETLVLSPLSATEAAMLVERLADTTVSSAVLEALYRRTAGNPFFVEEMVHQLRADGRDVADPAVASGEWGVPTGVRQAIEKRLSRLGDATARVLQAGAVLGDGFAATMAASVSGITMGDLLDAVDEAVVAGILREEAGAYHFAHPLIRATLDEDLGLPRRLWLHLRAAEAIESLRSDDPWTHVAALAVHYRLAGAVAPAGKALQFAVRAAEASDAVFAWEDAILHRRTALDLLPPGQDERRCDLLLALGESYRMADELDQANATCRETAVLARRLGSTERLVRAALTYPGAALSYPSEIAQADRYHAVLLEEALAVLDSGHADLRARVLARLARVLYYGAPRERMIALSHEALEVARSLGDPATLAGVLHEVCVPLWRLDDLGGVIALATELIEAAEQADDKVRAWMGYNWRLFALQQIGDLRGADADLGPLQRLCAQTRRPYRRRVTANVLAMRALLDSRLDDAERFAAEAWAVRLPDDWEGVAQHASFLFVSGRELGRAGQAAAIVREILRDHPHSHLWRSAMALILHSEGRTAEARAEFDRLSVHDFADLPRDFEWLDTAVMLAELCAAVGDTLRARILYDLLLPFAALHALLDGAGYNGAVEHYLGMLAGTLSRWDDASRHFEEAYAMHGRMGARSWQGHTRQRHARVLLASAGGQVAVGASARALLEEALSIYSELGLAWHEHDTRGLVAASPRTIVSYPDGLTAREAEVLGLIAAECSNREIAARLVVSPRTVERHIDNIYSKIGVHERRAARAYAVQHGLAAAPAPTSA